MSALLGLAALYKGYQQYKDNQRWAEEERARKRTTWTQADEDRARQEQARVQADRQAAGRAALDPNLYGGAVGAQPPPGAAPGGVSAQSLPGAPQPILPSDFLMSAQGSAMSPGIPGGGGAGGGGAFTGLFDPAQGAAGTPAATPFRPADVLTSDEWLADVMSYAVKHGDYSILDLVGKVRGAQEYWPTQEEGGQAWRSEKLGEETPAQRATAQAKTQDENKKRTIAALESRLKYLYETLKTEEESIRKRGYNPMAAGGLDPPGLRDRQEMLHGEAKEAYSSWLLLAQGDPAAMKRMEALQPSDFPLLAPRGEGAQYPMGGTDWIDENLGRETRAYQEGLDRDTMAYGEQLDRGGAAYQSSLIEGRTVRGAGRTEERGQDSLDRIAIEDYEKMASGVLLPQAVAKDEPRVWSADAKARAWARAEGAFLRLKGRGVVPVGMQPPRMPPLASWGEKFASLPDEWKEPARAARAEGKSDRWIKYQLIALGVKWWK